jgi:hypothetical protein
MRDLELLRKKHNIGGNQLNVPAAIFARIAQVQTARWYRGEFLS